MGRCHERDVSNAFFSYFKNLIQLKDNTYYIKYIFFLRVKLFNICCCLDYIMTIEAQDTEFEATARKAYVKLLISIEVS